MLTEGVVGVAATYLLILALIASLLVHYDMSQYSFNHILCIFDFKWLFKSP